MSFHRCLILCVLLAFAGQWVTSLNFQQKALLEFSELDDESDESEDLEQEPWDVAQIADFHDIIIVVGLNQSVVKVHAPQRCEVELCSPIENPPERV
ncbi:MAG: hypothetical protein RL432_2138 [Bacteroidota bacterium]|jgi:CRISPR/Cas system-associated protein Cas5 (RAMP superfamily)